MLELAKTKQAKRAEKAGYHQRRKKEAATKTQRATKKEQKKKRGKRVVNDEHIYKGGYTPDNEDNGESLTRELRAKQVRSESDSCGCKVEVVCTTERCGCVGSGKKCNDKCKCKDKYNNKLNTT